MKTKQAKLKEQAYASNLKSRALSVLIYLIDRSNQELTCFPAISTMAEQLHICISTVKRALRELVDGGYISKDARFREKNRGQSSNLYTLTLQQRRDGVENNDNPDAGKDSEPGIDNSSSIKEEQKQALSAAMPQRKGTKHISFENLKKKEEEPEEKAILRDCRPGKEETVAMECPTKGFYMMSKQKRSFCIYRRLVDCTPVHFGRGSFKACFRRLCVLWGRRIDRGIRIYASAYCLFLMWMGEGVNLNPP